MRDSEASATAQRVAAYRLGFDRIPASDGDPAADDRLARDVAGSVAAESGGRMSTYLAARTAFFDRVVVTGLDRGVSQVVVAAAGYDGRSLRYSRPGVRWFEVDHPATQEDKLRRIDRLGIEAGDVTFVPADFTSDEVGPRLIAAGCRSDVPSLMLCEGVAVYLERPVLAALLHGLRSAAAEGSRLAISLSVNSSDAGFASRRADFQATVAALGEPARTVLTTEDASALLGAAGWRAGSATADLGAEGDRAGRAGFVTAEAVGMVS